MPRLSTSQLVIPWFAAIASAGLACSFDTSGIDNGQPRNDGSPPVPDAALIDDAGNPLPCTQWRFAPAHFNPCAIDAPQGGLSLTLTNGTVRPYYIYDTNVGSLVDPNGATLEHVHQVIPGTPSFHLISVDDFTIAPNVRLRVNGPYPLLVASWSTITVDGEIDASSNAAETGAGANPTECGASTGGDGVQNNGGGGGGGGGFGAAGGAGGDGGNTNNTGGRAGSALSIARTLLRGGCAGGKGGQGDRADGGGAGGAGGGAIQLTARDSVSVAGTIHTGGQGGAAADPDLDADGNFSNDQSRKSGGGGGGSGGMIGIQTDALIIANGAVLATNGGGGGAGTDTNPGGPGDDATAAATAAAGGPGDNGGDGGDGGFRDTRDGRSALAHSKGAGGGGGGVGYIILDGISETIDPSALLSPNRTALPPARTSDPR